MIKGFFVSLIVAAAFFAAAWISVSVLGTRSMGAKEFEDMELFKGAPELTEIVSESKFKGEMKWEFDAEGTLGIVSSGADTRIKRTDGSKITLSVKTGNHVSAVVTAAESKESGYLGICVRENSFFFGAHSTEVEIGLPDKVFNGMEIELGSGELQASDIRADKSVLDIGSGKMDYRQAEEYGTKELMICLHSGKLNASEIKAEKAELDIGSGIMDYKQAEGYEAKELTISLSSGKLTASEIKAKRSELDIGSGIMEYAQAAGFKGEKLSVNIGSGNVKVTNADTEEYEISMGSGQFDVMGLTGMGEIDIGSGSGSADFAAIDPRGNTIDVSSGSLKVYIPRGGRAEVEADVSSGIVSVDCCGVSAKLKDDEKISLGQGGGKFTVDISSGKVSFLDSKHFDTEQITHVIQADIISAEATGFVTAEKDPPEYVVIG